MLLKKLYTQNQELTEKLQKANEKIKMMDGNYRTLQKQHLLLQHNIQNRIIGMLRLGLLFYSYSIIPHEPENSWVQRQRKTK